ncbi:MAG: Phosphoglycerate mutase family (Rhiz) [uncultured Sulfurovum sp.]|uniref:Phosphoglycerate mutase family (Rhiz) n=1 Tax=uncultured Sulfurovum sp. TaxID=269237 RepID=A0A6S6TH53_9BACT|nr:MAG: Phosphoglycerate mutase family (Rhiz) [uncultured Sulfurovum sp.]
MKLPTIYLLRHGQTVWNVEERYQGQLNSPLTNKGELQAKNNAKKLSKYIDINEVKFFSSPLGRAKQTAEIIAQANGMNISDIIFHTYIQEFNYGIFEGQTKRYCQTEYAVQFASREADKFNYVVEGGESYLHVYERLKLWLETVKEEKVIVVVAHEMVNRALRGIYCNMKTEEMLTLCQANDVLIKLENSLEEILD